MSPKRGARWVVLVAVLFAMAATTPAVAYDAVLYEVAENMKVRGGKIARRVAVATLVGKVKAGTPWCPAALGVPQCDINAIGWDSVDLTTGRGPVHAAFTMVVQGDNAVDGPELTVLTGTLTGKIDLSPAVLGSDGVPGTDDEIPYGTMTGKWTVRGDKDGPLAKYVATGRLKGVFRLPFTYGGSPPMYLTETGMELVGDGEHSLNVPAVRLEITFLSVQVDEFEGEGGGGPRVLWDPNRLR